MPRFLSFNVSPAALTLAMACFYAPGAAAHEGDIFQLEAGADMSYDSNLLRLPDNIEPAQTGVGDRPRHSWITSWRGTAKFDLPLSRQRVKASITSAQYRYEDYEYLDWNTTDYKAEWLWQLGSYWSGSVSYDHRRFLTGLADFRALIQNLRDVDSLKLSADYWLHPRWRLTGEYAENKATNSAASVRDGDLEQQIYSLGFRYVSSPGNDLHGMARYIDGRYPERDSADIFDRSYEQYDYGAEMRWRPHGKASLFFRLAYTQRVHGKVSARDFEGLTGRTEIDWPVSGKTGLAALLRREIGSVEDVTATYIVTNTARIAPYWTPTAKTRIDVSLERTDREYAGDPGSSTPDGQREDRQISIGTSLAWQPNAQLSLNLRFERSKRDSNREQQDFQANTAYAGLKLHW